MSDFSLEMTGDWNRAVIHLRNLAVSVRPTFEQQFYEDGEYILQKLRDHIDRQDLGWKPLAERTIALKGGDDTIYIETGELREALSVRRVKSSTKGSVIIVGASPWKSHSASGQKLSNIMMWLEYGTDKIPPRPLIRPTYEEVQDDLKKHWKEIFEEICKKGK